MLNLIVNSIDLGRAAVAEIRTLLGGELVAADGEDTARSAGRSRATERSRLRTVPPAPR